MNGVTPYMPAITDSMPMQRTTTLPRWLSDLAAASERLAGVPQAPTRAQDLAQATRLPAVALAHHLTLAGWVRHAVWSRWPDGRRRLTTWWAPAGQQPPRTPRGRPRVYATWDEIRSVLPQL